MMSVADCCVCLVFVVVGGVRRRAENVRALVMIGMCRRERKLENQPYGLYLYLDVNDRSETHPSASLAINVLNIANRRHRQT